MAKARVSRSAEGVAAMRAIEMRKPEADRISESVQGQELSWMSAFQQGLGVNENAGD